MTVTDVAIELNESELDLLMRNVPNEMINGFQLQNFRKIIGVSEDQFKSMVNDLRALPKGSRIVIDREQAWIFGNALSVVLKELGIEEFQTRTGCSFVEGQKTLQDLIAFCPDDSREVRD